MGKKPMALDDQKPRGWPMAPERRTIANKGGLSFGVGRGGRRTVAQTARCKFDVFDHITVGLINQGTPEALRLAEFLDRSVKA